MYGYEALGAVAGLSSHLPAYLSSQPVGTYACTYVCIDARMHVCIDACMYVCMNAVCMSASLQM